VALLAALVFLVSRERGVVAPPRAPGAAVPSKEQVEPQPPVALAPPALAPVAERAAVAPAPPAAPASLDAKTCEIRGRFVLPGGAPAVGAGYEIDGWGDDDEAQGHDPWADRTGETDAEGRLSERFVPPHSFQFTLEVKLAGYASAQWRWGEILAGAVVDVGEVELVAGGAIEGRIVDADGRTVPGEWMVYATSVALRGFDGRDETRVVNRANDNGSFRLEDVLPGRIELKADDDGWTETTIVQVRSGETATADIVTKRREAASLLRLRATWEYSGALGAEAEHVSLTGADGKVRRPSATSLAFFMGQFTFGELAAGEYQLAIDDPRFQPWTQTVRAGQTVEVELEGTSALLLSVRSADGLAAEFYSLVVELRNATFSPRSFEVSAASARLQHGRLGGLVPGDYRLTVRAGEALGSIDVDGLALGETRPVEVHLRTPPTIRGVVRYSDGVPAAGAEVTLLEAGGTQLSMSAMTAGSDDSDTAR